MGWMQCFLGFLPLFLLSLLEKNLKLQSFGDLPTPLVLGALNRILWEYVVSHLPHTKELDPQLHDWVTALALALALASARGALMVRSTDSSRRCLKGPTWALVAKADSGAFPRRCDQVKPVCVPCAQDDSA